MSAKKAAKPEQADAPAPAPAEEAISVASTPRAAASVRRVKSVGGIAGLAVVGLLSQRQGLPFAELGLRALAGGVVGFLAAWSASLAVWRNLIRAHVAVATREYAEAREREAKRRAAIAKEAEA